MGQSGSGKGATNGTGAKHRSGRAVVHETLRDVRERRALSLSDLADLAGVNRATIHRIEQGRTRPYPTTRRALAEALKVDVSTIAWPQ